MDISNNYYKAGLACHHEGNIDDALAFYQKALATNAQHAEAYHLMGVIFALKKQFDEAVHSIQNSLALRSDNALALNNLGKIFLDSGSPHSAIVNFDKALQLNPHYDQAHVNLGRALSLTGQFYSATNHFAKAIQLNPKRTEAHLLLATSLAALNQFDSALNHLQSLASQHPTNLLNPIASQINLQGVAYKEKIFKRVPSASVIGYIEAGLRCLGSNPEDSIEFFDAALSIEPRNAQAYFCKGNAYIELSKPYSAIECFDRAIALDPNHLDAVFNCGSALFSLKKYAEAQVQFERVLTANSLDNNALFYLALSQKENFLHSQAVQKLEQLYQLDPDYPLLLGHLIAAKMSICDWQDLDHLKTEMLRRIAHGQPVTTPFSTLSILDSIELQRQAGQIYLTTQFKPVKNDFRPVQKKYSKIKIGYFSTDFRNHAVSILTAQLYELHDRDLFEVNAFSIGPDVRDDMNRRLRNAFDQYIDANDWPEDDIILKARELQLDIAIDLSGYTSYSKPMIFAKRVAPVQINWLGYPGPMGHPEMDYIIADKRVIPPELRNSYSEKIIDLPCFQVNDQSRKISDKTFTKLDLGIPEDHFVFCSFNANAKLTPETFKAWMQILQAVQQSSLLLYAENEEVKYNLRQLMKIHGVQRDRVVFAEWLIPEDNLARYKTADLFLDTLPFNAGTTASDALWAGLPVLTCAGVSFASRMAASLLHAVGLPGLVAHTMIDYVKKAIELAQATEGTAKMKRHLAEHREQCILFNTPLFVSEFEAALVQIHNNP